MWISLGNYAKLAMIFAQTDPSKKHKGLACFLVPTDADGFSSQEIHGKLGLKGSDTAELSLDGVEVGDDALMGEIGDGFKIAMSALDSGRYSVAAGCVGICQASLDASVAYSKERTQFDRPIASFQLVQEMIADMVVQTDAARGLVWRAGWLKDQGKPNTTETSIAKLYATEAAVECANKAIQVHGGSGYVDDYPVERYLRDARVTTALRGHVPDPEADHRARGDRRERAGAVAMATVAAETRGAVGARAPRPPGGAQRAVGRADGGARLDLRALGRRPGRPLHRDRGRRRLVRRGRRHQGDGEADPRRDAHHRRRRASGRGSPRCGRRSWPPSPATRSAAAASWRWPAT